MRYGRLLKAIVVMGLVGIVMVGCSSEAEQALQENGTEKSIVIGETGESQTDDAGSQVKERTDGDIYQNPYSIRTETDADHIWYMSTDGIHQLNRSDGEDTLFLASDGIATLCSWKNWLYVIDNAKDGTDNNGGVGKTVWKIDKETGEMTDTGLKSEGFGVVDGILWDMRLGGTYSNLTDTVAVHYEGYTLNEETGDLEDKPVVLDDFGFGHAVLYPAFEVYDYLVMGDDFSQRLLWENDGTAMGSIVIEDTGIGEYETLMESQTLYYGGGQTFLYEIDDTLYEYHTDTGETETVLTGMDGQIFSIDTDFVYSYACPEGYAESGTKTLTLSRIDRKTGEQEEMCVLTNDWMQDPLNGRSDLNDIYVGDVVDGMFIYYDSEAGRIMVETLE